MFKITTVKQVEKLLNKTGFTKFLKSNLKSKFKTENGDGCAIARYLKFSGAKWASVCNEDINFNGYLLKNPVWVKRFIRTFDNENSYFVTGKRSLEILKTI